jgi:hypothetical protein
MSSLPMTTRNTLIEEVFSKEKKKIERFFRQISSKLLIAILLTVFSLFENLSRTAVILITNVDKHSNRPSRR